MGQGQSCSTKWCSVTTCALSSRASEGRWKRVTKKTTGNDAASKLAGGDDAGWDWEDMIYLRWEACVSPGESVMLDDERSPSPCLVAVTMLICSSRTSDVYGIGKWEAFCLLDREMFRTLLNLLGSGKSVVYWVARIKCLCTTGYWSLHCTARTISWLSPDSFPPQIGAVPFRTNCMITLD